MLFQILYLKIFLILGVLWIIESIHYIIHNHYGAPCVSFKSINFFFRIIDSCNMLRGFFLFIIFICKKNVWKKSPTLSWPQAQCQCEMFWCKCYTCIGMKCVLREFENSYEIKFSNNKLVKISQNNSPYLPKFLLRIVERDAQRDFFCILSKHYNRVEIWVLRGWVSVLSYPTGFKNFMDKTRNFSSWEFWWDPYNMVNKVLFK